MNPEQEAKFQDAIGDGSSWPKMTDDPLVNFEIDVYVGIYEGENIFVWNDLSKDVKQNYIDEVQLLKGRQRP